MSQLIKRTKKTCLKLLQRISSSKQLYMHKLEEDDISTQNVTATNENTNQCHDMLNFNKNNNIHDISFEQSQSITSATDVDRDDEPETVQPTQDELNNEILNTLTTELLFVSNGYDIRKLKQTQLNGDCEDIIFEKVPYKKNVRYFRHTPSSTSLDNYWETEENAREVEEMHSNYYNSLEIPNLRRDWNGNISRGSLHWDCNGNSLDDNLFINENIQSFNTKWFNMESKRTDDLKNNASQYSSTHSSSTTLETWLDDCTGYESEDFLLKDHCKQHRSGLSNI